MINMAAKPNPLNAVSSRLFTTLLTLLREIASVSEMPRYPRDHQHRIPIVDPLKSWRHGDFRSLPTCRFKDACLEDGSALPLAAMSGLACASELREV